MVLQRWKPWSTFLYNIRIDPLPRATKQTLIEELLELRVSERKVVQPNGLHQQQKALRAYSFTMTNCVCYIEPNEGNI